ncbi:MAG TPA: prepilin-type N-terminal cleavage/methylation domain-containing protein [Candidatus Angelobacter sp.]|jgi:prepilin-type N-terminal cleavage/methylation domain-containing protein|nr:prepilin-type N-terminal cleavage/methylation domain-containing protein [Candidatus Angelobacter sp.]
MTNQNKTKGFSLIELLIVVAVILIIAAIAIPNLLRSKMSANEASAVSTIRNVHNSQAVYILEFGGSVGYASTLVALGPGTPCSKAAACITDEMLGCAAEPCHKGGYLFYLNSTSAAEPYGDYTASATPVSWQGTGTNNFCSTEDGVVRKQKAPAAVLAAAEIHANCLNAATYGALGN